MPWDIVQQNGKHCVRKESTGEIVKCHTDPNKAKKHLRALYANAGDEYKEFVELLDEFITDGSTGTAVVVKELDDDTYHIRTISTAAVKDQQDHTFSTEAMDWDIQMARTTGIYPEYRMFHSKALPFGKVHTMYRVGIFAVEEGTSYPDDFSKEVVEKLLLNNDGTWRVSRGFRAYELSGDCPGCNSALLLKQEHFLVGFTCPTCNSLHMTFKGMGGITFRKARTFDVTITDVPVVEVTSAHAYKLSDVYVSEDMMNKEQLKQRLLKAGIAEDVVNAKLESVDEDVLKELDGVPEATLLKELDVEKETPANDEQVFYLDPETLAQFAVISKQQVEAALEGFEIIVDSGDELFKELPDLVQLKEDVASLQETVEAMFEFLKSGEDKLAPRTSKLRVMKAKTAAPPEDDEEDDEEEMAKEMARWIKSMQGAAVDTNGAIVDGRGNTYKSMTEMVTGGHNG